MTTLTPFDPETLDTGDRLVYEMVGMVEYNSLDEWVGSAYSALRMIADPEDLTEEQARAMLHILFKQAPTEVVRLGDAYDALSGL